MGKLPDSDLKDLILSSFAVEGPLNKNIGKLVKYVPDGGIRKDLSTIGEIVGVQKGWGYNEQGKYVFGVILYRIIDVEPSSYEWDGEIHSKRIERCVQCNLVEILENTNCL